jgi:hypothetical protein
MAQGREFDRFGVYILGLCLVLTWMACAQSPDFPDEPTLTFDRLSKPSFTKQEGRDTMFLFVKFTDGNGDFGSSTTSNETNLFITDSRSNFTEEYKAPFIPAQGTKNGVSGTIKILLKSPCCIYPNAAPCEVVPEVPTNSLSYKIRIKDRSGNVSNEVTTPLIELACKK